MGEVIIRSKLDTENISIEVEDYGEGIYADNINEILHISLQQKRGHWSRAIDCKENSRSTWRNSTI